MTNALSTRLRSADRRLTLGLRAFRLGKITKEEYEARKAEYKAIGDAIIAEQLTAMAEARTERDQSDWSEGNVRTR